LEPPLSSGEGRDEFPNGTSFLRQIREGGDLAWMNSSLGKVNRSYLPLPSFLESVVLPQAGMSPPPLRKVPVASAN